MTPPIETQISIFHHALSVPCRVVEAPAKVGVELYIQSFDGKIALAINPTVFPFLKPGMECVLNLGVVANQVEPVQAPPALPRTPGGIILPRKGELK
jgi:hypothetical protein